MSISVVVTLIYFLSFFTKHYTCVCVTHFIKRFIKYYKFMYKFFSFSGNISHAEYSTFCMGVFLVNEQPKILLLSSVTQFIAAALPLYAPNP